MRKLRTIICTGLAFIVLALAHQHIGLRAGEARKCAASAAVRADFASHWCQVAAHGDRGFAYARIADELHGLRRYKEALRMYEAAGELGSAHALVSVGLYLLEGIHGETDKRRGIAVLESAARLGHRSAVANLTLAYHGNFGEELRDPMMEAMWVFAHEAILRDRLGDFPLTYAKELGLSDADIQEVKRRLAEWIAKNKPVWRPDYDTPPPRDGTWR